MFIDDNFNYSEISNSILEGKDQCPDTSCVRNLIDFLQEQIEVLEDECYEREIDLEEIYNENE
jgi:hypothetical protein|tara:strand:- start:274 stop:462 length:189 start_codon:yes stop_codon:yes gene_type:complete